MPHSLKQDGLLEPEAIAAMSEAFEAALKELQDTGHPFRNPNERVNVEFLSRTRREAD